MYTVILYVTLCLTPGECYAQEPLSWTADAGTLAVTAGLCQDLAAELISDDGPNTVNAECHVTQSDEQDRHDAGDPAGAAGPGDPRPYEQDRYATQKAKN